MSTFQQAAMRNRLLQAIPEADFVLLAPHATHRSYQPRDIVIQSEDIIREFYFPETGMISVVTPDETEVGVVGREGVTGLPALLGAERGPLRAMCQMPSEGTCIPCASFLSIAAASATLSQTMLRYVHAFSIQLASTAYSNSSFSVEQRLARWILMCHDRADDDTIIVTHEFLAMMLGVRRPGVTVATHVLEGLLLIRATRGRIQVRDRERLSAMADGGYGGAEAEYDRVMSPDGRLAPSLRLATPSLSIVR